MKEKIGKSVICPTKEELGAFFDNQLSNDQGIAMHINKCGFCQKELTVYKKIKEAIEAQKITVPKGLSDKLKAHIKKNISSLYINKNIINDEEFEHLAAAGTNQIEIPSDSIEKDKKNL